MYTIKLIVTDLDGTLIGNDNEFAFCTRLSEVMGTYRARHDTVWVVCSGRSRRSVADSIEILREMGLDPDYVIVRSAFVYANQRHHLRAQHAWNWSVRIHMLMSFLCLRSALRDWQREINRTFKNVICIYQRRNRLCLRFRNQEDAESGADILRQKAKVFRHLRVYHHLSEVRVHSVTFTKGMAVEELAAHLGVKRSDILCIGNGISDITMLDGSVAAYTGCPANAEMDVMDQVHQTGGYIAEGRSMEGVVEILKGYLQGEIHNRLPDWWSPTHIPKQPDVGSSRRHPPPRKPIQASQRTALQLVLLAAYAVLVVFASFDLVPFSNIIMKPFVLVAGGVQRLLLLLM